MRLNVRPYCLKTLKRTIYILFDFEYPKGLIMLSSGGEGIKVQVSFAIWYENSCLRWFGNKSHMLLSQCIVKTGFDDTQLSSCETRNVYKRLYWIISTVRRHWRGKIIRRRFWLGLHWIWIFSQDNLRQGGKRWVSPINECSKLLFRPSEAFNSTVLDRSTI